MKLPICATAVMCHVSMDHEDREFQEEAQKVLEGVVYSGAYAAGGGETFTGRVVKHCLALGLEHCPQLYQAMGPSPASFTVGNLLKSGKSGHKSAKVPVPYVAQIFGTWGKPQEF